ncbi:hypothetical protein [Halomonas sp. B23F22_10]|uniref:hypothetical protein n=1 Tax=Halomonas sp. B23F22_10 TaxID=3459515 RepID=UPI00373F3611
MKIFRSEPSRRNHYCEDEVGLIDRLFVNSDTKSSNFNRRMFDEDFARIFYPSNYRDGDFFEIVSNSEEVVEKLLSNARTRYASHSIDKKIRELVEEIGQSLIWFGRAFYFLYKDEGDEKVHVVSFRSAGVVRLFGTHIQWLPKFRERHWGRDDEQLPREVRILDGAKLMRFDMPISFKRMLNAQNKTLAVIDKHEFEATNFHPQATYENPNPTTYFDFRVWREIQDRALYRATQSTGWNGRKHDSSKRSDFFDCHRLIRFRRNQLLLRDEILKQLSIELSRVGKGYKSDFSVKISSSDELSSVERLNELEVRLAREEVGFKEVIDYCYKG